MWFWLARIITGRSQYVRPANGADKVSRAITPFKNCMFEVVGVFSQRKENSEISKAWVEAAAHSCF